MTAENIVFLEMILDATALLLGGLSIAGVLLLRGRGERKNVTTAASQPKEQFNDVLVDWVQRTEQTFEKVTEALREEREALQGIRHLASHKAPTEMVTGNVTSLSDASRRREIRRSRPVDRVEEGHEEPCGDNRYGEVTELAQNGMSEQEIAETINLPRSEVELILALNEGP
jgi:hypothetical protein